MICCFIYHWLEISRSDNSRKIKTKNILHEWRIIKSTMLFNKYKTWRTSFNWDNYRKQRTLVTKIKKQSMRVFFLQTLCSSTKIKGLLAHHQAFISKKGYDGVDCPLGEAVLLTTNLFLFNNCFHSAEILYHIYSLVPPHTCSYNVSSIGSSNEYPVFVLI